MKGPMDTLSSLVEGKHYLFFTVTYFFVGTVERITATDVVLKDAWLVYNVPDVGKLVATETASAMHNALAADPPPAFVGAMTLRSIIGAAQLQCVPAAARKR